MEIIYRENDLFVCIYFKHLKGEEVVSCGAMRMWASQSDVRERASDPGFQNHELLNMLASCLTEDS